MTLGSPGLPFDMNQFLLLPGLSHLGGACTLLGRLRFVIVKPLDPTVGLDSRTWTTKSIYL